MRTIRNPESSAIRLGETDPNRVARVRRTSRNGFEDMMLSR